MVYASFAERLRALMDRRGIGVRALARKVPCDPGHVSKLRSGREKPSHELARLLDDILDARGELAALVPARPKRENGADAGLAVVQPNGGSITPDDEERLAQAARAPSRLDLRAVDSLAAILAEQRRLEDRVGSAPLVAPVRAQLATLEAVVIQARGPVRPRVLDVAAQWAEFAGWLNTNTERAGEARAWYDRAAEWAAETGDTTMAATVLSFRGHLAYLLGQIGPMVGLSQAAQRDPAVWVGQRAYDAHQEGRGLAVMGETEAAVRKLDQAAELAEVAALDGGDPPPWIYYYTPPFFLLERGWAYRYLGRDDPRYNDEAIRLLTAGLGGLDEDARRSEWAIEYLYHLAIAHMQADAPDRACAIALEATTIARITESARMLRQLSRLHARLTEKWPDHPAVTELADALR
ncbi:MAG: helix-turn-helix domain-containing protein [Streptosporangiales bacterium]|nr:helix-turn-helix domain-containing protein [Streptosporangiales bacterium]